MMAVRMGQCHIALPLGSSEQHCLGHCALEVMHWKHCSVSTLRVFDWEARGVGWRI